MTHTGEIELQGHTRIRQSYDNTIHLSFFFLSEINKVDYN